mgnify:CR=1 FL=1
MASIVDTFLVNMNQLGFFDFLLPWLFTFAIVYGLLTKLNLFGDVNPKISAVLAIVFAFFTAPFAGVYLATFFATLGTEITIVLSGLLTVMLFASILGFEGSAISKIPHAIYAVIGLGAIVFFIALGGEIQNINLGTNTVMTAVFILVLVAAVWFIVGRNGGSASAPTSPPAE